MCFSLHVYDGVDAEAAGRAKVWQEKHTDETTQVEDAHLPTSLEARRVVAS